jgi:hypothetical protein
MLSELFTAASHEKLQSRIESTTLSQPIRTYTATMTFVVPSSAYAEPRGRVKTPAWKTAAAGKKQAQHEVSCWMSLSAPRRRGHKLTWRSKFFRAPAIKACSVNEKVGWQRQGLQRY